MPRTTLNIDAPILTELKQLRRTEGKSLGQLVSELLGEALGRHRGEPGGRRLDWAAQDMGARVDIGDKEALIAALDRDQA